MELNGNTLVSGNADSAVKVYTNAFMYNVHMICVGSTVLYLNLIQHMCMQCSVVWANNHLKVTQHVQQSIGRVTGALLTLPTRGCVIHIMLVATMYMYIYSLEAIGSPPGHFFT